MRLHYMSAKLTGLKELFVTKKARFDLLMDDLFVS
jgi:hypothetical protein